MQLQCQAQSIVLNFIQTSYNSMLLPRYCPYYGSLSRHVGEQIVLLIQLIKYRNLNVVDSIDQAAET